MLGTIVKRIAGTVMVNDVVVRTVGDRIGEAVVADDIARTAVVNYISGTRATAAVADLASVGAESDGIIVAVVSD